MNEWKIQGSRVYRDGHSFNCTNRVTATDLHNILNTYEHIYQLNKNLDKQYDSITKQIIKIQCSQKKLEKEINNLHESIDGLKVEQ